MLYQLGDEKPPLRGDRYLAPGAQVIENVNVAKGVTIGHIAMIHSCALELPGGKERRNSQWCQNRKPYWGNAFMFRENLNPA